MRVPSEKFGLGGDVRRKQAGQGLSVYGAYPADTDTLIKAVDCFD